MTMGEERRNDADNPGVIAPPPLIYAGARASGLLANRLYPIPFLPDGISRALGWPSIFAGLAIGLLSFREMERARTNVDPYKPTTAIVVEGPYRYTRNPLYGGMTLTYAGVSARADALLAALFLPAVLAVMWSGVIGVEKRYLEREFDDQYSGYKTRVRRWI